MNSRYSTDSEFDLSKVRIAISELPILGSYLMDHGFVGLEESVVYRVRVTVGGHRVIGKWDETK